MSEARRMLDLAARLALRARGDVEPNPLVGAVIVREGRVIGMGHHQRWGGPHAEPEALDDCRRRGADPRGATMYVTLEPCPHHGKTPPCTDRILAAGVRRVVYARADPGPVSSGGADVLRNAGVEAELSGDSTLATGISAPFVKRAITGMPWVIAKWAQTIDGRIATRTGESKWISSDLSRRRVHRLRSRVDAIITGLGTVVADDPMLTARGVRRVRRVARRVVVDAGLDISPDAALVRTARDVPTIVVCARELLGASIVERRRGLLTRAGVELLGVPTVSGAGPHRIDLAQMLRQLWERHGVATALIESGPGLLGAMFEADLVDEVVVHQAPLLLGDELAMAVARGRVAAMLSSGLMFDLWRARPLAGDVELVYRRRR